MAEQKGEIIIYRTEDGKAAIDIRLQDENIWLTQQQIVKLFQSSKANISEHIKHIFQEGELRKDAVVRKIRTTASDGKSYNYDYYSLDLIISVGYRVNSKRGTQFRIWATRVLRDHLLKGYTVDKKALSRSTANVDELQRTISLITSVRNKRLSSDEAQGLLAIIKQYTDTWTTLEAYDSRTLAKRTSARKSIPLSLEEASAGLAQLKHELVRKGEAGELFGVEHGHGLDRILGAVFQTFSGTELYPSIEEKAAHLLYFTIKDHPFSDGNKRSGAFLFLEFLRKNRSLTK
ncbi:MAG: virulence protein RhuM/Fic/DOC family protein, partial [Bacteroidota bacterium]